MFCVELFNQTSLNILKPQFLKYLVILPVYTH